MEKKNVSDLDSKSNANFPVIQPVDWSLYGMRYPGLIFERYN